MANLHQILIPTALGLLVGAFSGTFAVYLAQSPVLPPPPQEACHAALVQRISYLEDEVFALGSLVELYQGEFSPRIRHEPIQPDLQDALDVLPLGLGTFMRLTNPAE